MEYIVLAVPLIRPRGGIQLEIPLSRFKINNSCCFNTKLIHVQWFYCKSGNFVVIIILVGRMNHKKKRKIFNNENFQSYKCMPSCKLYAGRLKFMLKSWLQLKCCLSGVTFTEPATVLLCCQEHLDDRQRQLCSSRLPVCFNSLL